MAMWGKSSLSHCIQLVLPIRGLSVTESLKSAYTHTHTHTHKHMHSRVQLPSFFFFLKLLGIRFFISNHLLEPLMNLKLQALDAGRQGNPKPLAAAAAKSLQSCPTLCNPMDGSPPVSPVPGILQARTLEWVAISFSSA